MNYVTLSLWASPLLLWASMFPSVRWGQWWKLHLRLLAALFLVPSAPSFEGRGCYCPTLPFPSLLPPNSWVCRGRQNRALSLLTSKMSMSALLKSMLRILGRGTPEPSTAVGKKNDQVQSAWPRGINLSEASSIMCFMPPGLCPCLSLCWEHTTSPLPACWVLRLPRNSVWMSPLWVLLPARQSNSGFLPLFLNNSITETTTY